MRYSYVVEVDYEELGRTEDIDDARREELSQQVSAHSAVCAGQESSLVEAVVSGAI